MPGFPLKSCLPHARGGVSWAPLDREIGYWSSPRTWGCFRCRPSQTAWGIVFPTHVGVFPHQGQQGRFQSVFPTHVGVFLLVTGQRHRPLGLPHARGGVSGSFEGLLYLVQSSPRTWGCFRIAAEHGGTAHVFPTHVGVFLTRPPSSRSLSSLPHARGGVSDGVVRARIGCQSSPRTWGCFHKGRCQRRRSGVFPTHVGVFLRRFPSSRGSARLPHARGGVSRQLASVGLQLGSSPRTWGCFRSQSRAEDG